MQDEWYDASSTEDRALLYLAGELTPEHRERFEREMAGSETIRLQVAQAAGAQEFMERALSDYDAHVRLPAPESVVIGRAARSISQWTVKRTLTPQASLARRGGIAAPWKYSSVAAGLLIAAGLALHFRHSRTTPAPTGVDSETSYISPGDAIAQLDDSQSQALLEAFAGRGADQPDGQASPTAVANNFDEHDREIAGLQRVGDTNNVFMGISAQEYRQELQ